MSKPTFYHAGCPVCRNVEKVMLGYLDKNKLG